MTLENKSDDHEGIAAVRPELDYGMGHNEMRIGRALKYRRSKAWPSVK